MFVREEYFRCGSCRAFESTLTDRMGRHMGHCDVKPRQGSVSAGDYACLDYRLERDRLQPGAVVPEDADVTPRERERKRRLQSAGDRLRKMERRTPRPRAEEPVRVRLEEIPLGEEDAMDRAELKAVLAEVLDEALGISDAPMHKRFMDGKIIMVPGNPELASKEIEVDVFFRKIVSVRDKLRVLEQKINANEELGFHDKGQLQGYITGCYGALKTFNLLFQDREDWFGS